MSQDLAFRRKVIYIAIVALLLYPLFRLGQPATTIQPGRRPGPAAGGQQPVPGRPGRNRSRRRIDEAGHAGNARRGGQPAVGKGQRLQDEVEDWDNLSATLNQITKLQPNFISVWEFQAHNLSYNVSVEFDDYRHRYHWVKKGISFLIDGIRHNRDNPRLLHQTGWFIGQKIGRADEHVHFRRMFREDQDFHDELTPQRGGGRRQGVRRPARQLAGRPAVVSAGLRSGGRQGHAAERQEPADLPRRRADVLHQLRFDHRGGGHPRAGRSAGLAGSRQGLGRVRAAADPDLVGPQHSIGRPGGRRRRGRGTEPPVGRADGQRCGSSSARRSSSN